MLPEESFLLPSCCFTSWQKNDKLLKFWRIEKKKKKGGKKKLMTGERPHTIQQHLIEAVGRAHSDELKAGGPQETGQAFWGSLLGSIIAGDEIISFTDSSRLRGHQAGQRIMSGLRRGLEPFVDPEGRIGFRLGLAGASQLDRPMPNQNISG